VNGESTAAPAGESSFSIWLAAARPRTLTASIAPVVLGLGLAWHHGRLDALVAAATMAAAVLIQVGTNLANDYYDFISGADTAERLGPLRVTQAGLAEPAAVRNAAFAVLGLAALLGVYLSYVGGWPILAVGLLSLIAAVAYTAGPWPLAHRGLGEVFVFIFFGPVAVNGTLFLQTGKVTPLSALGSVAMGCLVSAILVVNNLRDIPTDALAGKRTLAVRLGRRFTEGEYFALLGIAFGLVPVMAWIGGTWLLLAASAIPIGFGEAVALHRRSGAALNESLGGTAKLAMAYAVLLSIALVL
jgi:1,4-dihydroxy-2-naphthoate polyprenyltransferase